MSSDIVTTRDRIIKNSGSDSNSGIWFPYDSMNDSLSSSEEEMNNKKEWKLILNIFNTISGIL